MPLSRFAIGAIGGGAAGAVLMLFAIDAASEAREARFARVQAEQRDRATVPPLPAIPPRSAIAAGDADAAARTLVRLLRRDAERAGLLVERATALPTPGGGVAAVDVSVSGSEKAVLAYADALPRGRPIVGLFEWRVVAVDQAHVRLDASAVAAWR